MGHRRYALRQSDTCRLLRSRQFSSRLSALEPPHLQVGPPLAKLSHLVVDRTHELGQVLSGLELHTNSEVPLPGILTRSFLDEFRSER